MSRERKGLLYGVGAYVLWGLLPLYWPLLEPAAPVEILAHRIVWSLAFLLVLLAVGAGFAWVRRLERRQVGLLALAAVLVAFNWGLYIHGVNSDQVVETSLGYFVNPLISVALGVTLLGERLRRNQQVAVGVGAVAVVVLALDYGRLPWLALSLAVSFALYGLVKKRAGVDGVQSLGVETALLVVPAVGYLLWLEGDGTATFASLGAGHTALLVLAGIPTALPLIFFGAAAIRIPLSSLGLLQYLAPVLQFSIGVLVYGEPMPASRLAGFALVWLALAVLSLDALHSARGAAAARGRVARA